MLDPARKSPMTYKEKIPERGNQRERIKKNPYEPTKERKNRNTNRYASTSDASPQGTSLSVEPRTVVIEPNAMIDAATMN